MALPRVSAASFRRFTLASLWALALIVVVGATVRLTGSGLGCPDWPTCTEQRVVAPLEYHAMIEFVNRAFSGVVGLVVGATAVASLLRVPRRRDLVWLSAGLVAGVVVQILIGRLTIEAELAPQVVMSHFLVAIVLLANALVLWHVASPAGAAAPGPPPLGEGADPAGARPAAAPVAARSPLVPLAWLLVAVTAVVIVLGTVVTAAGPHGGDERARRLDVFLPDAARAHGISVVVLLVLTLFTLWRVWRDGAPAAVRRRGEVLLAVLVAQAVVGYVQYFSGVPVLLVLVHVAGAVGVWIAVLGFALGVGTGAEPRVAPASPPPRTAERIAM